MKLEVTKAQIILIKELLLEYFDETPGDETEPEALDLIYQVLLTMKTEIKNLKGEGEKR